MALMNGATEGTAKTLQDAEQSEAAAIAAAETSQKADAEVDAAARVEAQAVAKMATKDAWLTAKDAWMKASVKIETLNRI
jgi:hypothetical protein